MVDEIVLSKGSYSVTVYVDNIDDNLNNNLFKITPPTGSQNQDTGSKDTKVVDMLRIVRTFKVKGYITSNTEKSDLINILNGGGVGGGGINLYFSEGGDATDYTVFVETCTFTYEANDEPASHTDYAKHRVNITLIKGVKI